MNKNVLLFILGLTSFVCAPFTSIAGIIIGHKMTDRDTMGNVGYWMCWIFTVLIALAFVGGFIAALVIPALHRR